MTTTYRTAGAWGAGKGSDLTPAEVDNNFYDKETRITAVEVAGVGVGITSITVSGNQMTITLTDSSIQGPFTIPTATFNARGEWVAATLYYANDIISNAGSVYLVLVDHTSDTVFDPLASATSTGDLYALIWTFPSTPGYERTGATFTPALEDANSYNRLTNAAGCAVTIDGSVAFPPWTELHFRDASTDTGANISFTTSNGATINDVTGFLNESGAQGGTITLKKVGATGAWDIFGLLASA